MKSILTGLFLLTSIYIIFLHQGKVLAAPSNTNALDTHRSRIRAVNRISPRPIGQYARLKLEPLGDFIDDDDLFELSKRQTSDDYGHLRFGKRDEQFDDYGHMRFGRSGTDK